MRVVVRDSLGTARPDYSSIRYDRIMGTLFRCVRALLPPAPSRWLRKCAESDKAVALLLFAISVSFIAIRMGAVAFELTGVPWEHAKLRALSAFTNAGFTTRESEEITSHTLRRRIASFLIVVGNAGLINHHWIPGFVPFATAAPASHRQPGRHHRWHHCARLGRPSAGRDVRAPRTGPPLSAPDVRTR
jgi:hypothetical protein